DYFLGLGGDLFYAQRGISPPGQIPIGFLTVDPLSGEEIQRYVGVFLSPDKVGYVAGLLALLLLGFINIRYRVDAVVNTFVVLCALVFIFLFHVKAVALQFAAFAASFFLIRYFGFRSFVGR